jgi:acyl-ACP thioesterase
LEQLVSLPQRGRTFTASRRTRLSDVDKHGRLRLDAVARYLQDVATDDVEETGWGAPDHLWVIRHVRLDVISPLLDDREVELHTWCSGVGSVSAARRWSLAGDRGGQIEVDSIWIHLAPSGRPARLDQGFGIYAEAANGRGASTKLELPDPPAEAVQTPWPLRATDIDLLGHLNNAAYWHAIEHMLPRVGPDPRKPFRARLDYRQPIDLEERVELAEFEHDEEVGVAFVSDGVVKAVAALARLD